MIMMSKQEFIKMASSEKLSLLTEVQTPYDGGFKVSEKSVYALDRSGCLVAFYSAKDDTYIRYTKPIRSFSKTRRKFKKAIL